MLRTTNNSPGPASKITSGETRESQQPITITSGDWPRTDNSRYRPCSVGSRSEVKVRYPSSSCCGNEIMILLTTCWRREQGFRPTRRNVIAFASNPEEPYDSSAAQPLVHARIECAGIG